MLYNHLNLSVAKIADSNSGRPELRSVFFTPNKTVATDSFRLIEVSTDTSINLKDFPEANIMRGCSPFMVEARDIKNIKLKPNKNLPILGYMALRHLDDKKVSFVLKPDVTATAEPTLHRIDSRFPDYGKMFPQVQPKAEVKVNAKYLSGLLDIMGEFNRNEVTIKIYDENKPIVLEAGNVNQKGRAMVMPIRK